MATATALGFILATLLMLLAGMSKQRIEWKPRRPHRPRRKDP